MRIGIRLRRRFLGLRRSDFFLGGGRCVLDRNRESGFIVIGISISNDFWFSRDCVSGEEQLQC